MDSDPALVRYWTSPHDQNPQATVWRTGEWTASSGNPPNVAEQPELGLGDRFDSTAQIGKSIFQLLRLPPEIRQHLAGFRLFDCHGAGVCSTITDREVPKDNNPGAITRESDARDVVGQMSAQGLICPEAR